MSYYVIVYDRENVFHSKADLLSQVEKEKNTKEKSDFEDYQKASEDLRAWFLEMIKNFPPARGEFSPEKEKVENNEELRMHLTDYFVSSHMIYAAFHPSVRKQAGDVAKKLTMVYDLGFYDTDQ
ncbi:MAG: hypothetical protein Q4C69_03980 [Lachnoclostridium edouardi]|uniref:hypothetical protein n=1 Tax=Lachnoclostridium edouardi TaxID=1926283 RepID=UPI0026DB3DC9|nr:hypothetical protein [Lachnoclostridium edouardi]MDO4277970.1 hypothetical protein [Lachnoclostridium edouardi]